MPAGNLSHTGVVSLPVAQTLFGADSLFCVVISNPLVFSVGIAPPSARWRARAPSIDMIDLLGEVTTAFVMIIVGTMPAPGTSCEMVDNWRICAVSVAPLLARVFTDAWHTSQIVFVSMNGSSVTVPLMTTVLP